MPPLPFLGSCLRLVGAALLIAATTTPGLAQRIALVIGNSDYAAIGRLANPRNDAELMAGTLSGLGFQVTKLIDADQRTMKQAMLDFGRSLRDGVEASLFYYAGHGVQANGQNYLVPVDAVIRDQGELDLQAIDVNAFLRVMQNSASKVNIVVLDACRNNPFASSLRSATRGLAMVDAPRGTYIAYSTAPGTAALDGNGSNSPYTLALTRAMQSPGLKIEDTFKQTRRIVLEETRNEQVPWETSSITGDFFFRPGSAQPLPSPTVALAPPPTGQTPGPNGGFAPDDEVWAKIGPSNDLVELEAFLKAFPASRHRAAAEDRIRQLRQLAALPPTPVPAAPPVRTTGTLQIPQTYLADLDQGTVTQAGADLWFEAETATQLYVTPSNGAALAVGDLSRRNLEACRSARYDAYRVPLSALPPGSFLCVRTNEGRFALVGITALTGASPRTLSLSYLTWE